MMSWRGIVQVCLVGVITYRPICGCHLPLVSDVAWFSRKLRNPIWVGGSSLAREREGKG